MNALEKQIIAHLKIMKDNYEVHGVKAEFEAEGVRFEELLRLKIIAQFAGLGVTIKIGGAEDVWGILQARKVDVSCIVAPMVETSYALSKFLAASKKHIPENERPNMMLAVNIETLTAHKNLDEILQEGKNGGLDAVTLGRVDMISSLKLGRSAIDSDKMFQITKDICERTKQAGFMMTMGGSIETGTYPIICKLLEQKILDRFETRKIIFGPNTASEQKIYERAILAAHRFELLWLENKKNLYDSMANEDWERIPLLYKRIHTGGEYGNE